MSVCTTVLSTRSFAPSSNPEFDRCPNHQIVDRSQRLWGQTDEATLKGVMLRHRRAVEVGELTKRQSICDAFTQLAIVPVLQPHQNQRAQNLRRR